MVMGTQDPLLQAGAGIDDVLVPLVGLTVLGATFGAPGLMPDAAAMADGAALDGVDAVAPA
jgi:hypothetical protein